MEGPLRYLWIPCVCTVLYPVGTFWGMAWSLP